MLTEAPYFFAIATLSLTLAGFAGLVAALHRGSPPSGLDVFRLREIVEYGFTNALLSLAAIPLTSGLGEAAGVRGICVLTIAALAADSILLLGRARAIPELRRGGSLLSMATLAAAILGAALVGALSGAVLALMSTLLLNLARPMLTFTFVLRAIDRER